MSKITEKTRNRVFELQSLIRETDITKNKYLTELSGIDKEYVNKYFPDFAITGYMSPREKSKILQKTQRRRTRSKKEMEEHLCYILLCVNDGWVKTSDVYERMENELELCRKTLQNNVASIKAMKLVEMRGVKKYTELRITDLGKFYLNKPQELYNFIKSKRMKI